MAFASIFDNQIFISFEAFTCILFIQQFSGSRSNKTFKPKKNIPEGTHQYDLMKHAAVTLGSGNLRQAVSLPEGEDLNEWVAVNSEYFLLHANKKYEINVHVN